MSQGVGSEGEGEARLLLPPRLNMLGYFFVLRGRDIYS